MKPVVLITGAAGLIGHYLVKNATRWGPGWEVSGPARSVLDLTDFQQVESYWRSVKPALVIHSAALSRTKDCERNPDHARRVNVAATAHLAALARDVPFLFLSSGEVFDGRKSWYDETDAATPINVYGNTKLEAEQIVLQNPRHTVLRIVLTAGTSRHGDRSFVEDMSRAAAAGNRITLYVDEFRCPLPAGVIARAVWELIGHERPGLYHLGGSERLSRWEIGQSLLPWYPEFEGRLAEGVARDQGGAPRPRDLSLRCGKLQELLSFQIPGFRAWLRERPSRGTDLWDYDLP